MIQVVNIRIQHKMWIKECSLRHPMMFIQSVFLYHLGSDYDVTIVTRLHLILLNMLFVI